VSGEKNAVVGEKSRFHSLTPGRADTTGTRILVWVGPERVTRAMARQAELTGKRAFSAPTFLWSGNLSQERTIPRNLSRKGDCE
jgi:hypothetical protein